MKALNKEEMGAAIPLADPALFAAQDCSPGGISMIGSSALLPWDWLQHKWLLPDEFCSGV